MTGVSLRFGLLATVVGILALASLAFRPTSTTPPKTRESWKTGYWVWAGETPVSADFTPQILYVEAPALRWPRSLPPAEQFVVVQRLEPATPLTTAAAVAIAARYRTLVADAGAGVRIVGLQIDYDCPTRALESYGTFLRQVHQRLPAGSSLSITALLDWFGPRTNVTSALREVDEFVPQFYDTAHERTSAGIAQPIDAVRWAPVFNAYHVSYRIGISSFGRVARRRVDASGRASVQYFRDVSPMAFAGRQPLTRSITTTSTGELVVRYDVRAPIDDTSELQAGDVVEITFPTEASVGAAYEAARQFGGFCAGVLAFRWPSRSETVTLAPDDVERIASGERLSPAASLDVRHAPCIERECADLSVDLGGAVSDADGINRHPRGRACRSLPARRPLSFAHGARSDCCPRPCLRRHWQCLCRQDHFEQSVPLRGRSAMTRVSRSGFRVLAPALLTIAFVGAIAACGPDLVFRAYLGKTFWRPARDRQ